MRDCVWVGSERSCIVDHVLLKLHRSTFVQKVFLPNAHNFVISAAVCDRIRSKLRFFSGAVHQMSMRIPRCRGARASPVPWSQRKTWTIRHGSRERTWIL